MYVYIDESGDHNLDMARVDNNYNIFVLGSVLINKKRYEEVDRDFKSIKKYFFNDENFIRHTKDLIRPNQARDERNKLILNKDKRIEFYNEIISFLDRAPLQVCFVVIKKIHFQNKYATPSDPYDISFENLLNRILYYSKSNEIEIYPECRKGNLDKRLEADFKKYSQVGIEFHTANEMKDRIKNFQLKDKKENITGLQIVDLLVSPVGRHFLGIAPRIPGNEIPYTSVRKKLAGNLALTIIP